MSGVDSAAPLAEFSLLKKNSLHLTGDLLYENDDIHIYWIWQMELRHLRYFIAVAEEKHVTRAAERLGIQQPPLSQQIRALERELDVQLFHRKPRGVELTDAGSALLADARAILSHFDHAFATTKRTARGEQGKISVGFTSSAPSIPSSRASFARIGMLSRLCRFLWRKAGQRISSMICAMNGSTPRSSAR
jgi:Bacterial regulatory helix-turn-helix protein, lysR family